MKSTFIRYFNICILSCVALVGSSLIGSQAHAEYYTYRNTNNIVDTPPIPNYDFGGNTISGDAFSFINYFPTDGTFTASSFFLCTADKDNYNGDDYAPSVNLIDTILDGNAYLYVNSNCITFLSQSNSYTGGTCIDGASLFMISPGTLGSENAYLYLTNNAFLDLGGTTQKVQSLSYTPFNPDTAPTGSFIANGTVIDATGKSTTFDASGNVVTAPQTNGPVAPPMPPMGK